MRIDMLWYPRRYTFRTILERKKVAQPSEYLANVMMTGQNPIGAISFGPGDTPLWSDFYFLENSRKKCDKFIKTLGFQIS